MENTDNLFTKEVSIKSPTFSVDDIGYYQLQLSLSTAYFKVCAMSSTDNSCVFLESYRFFDALSGDDLLGALHQIYDYHPFLKANYWHQVRIVLPSDGFSLVPKELFIAKDVSQYLHLASEVNSGQTVEFSDFTFADAVTVFTLSTHLKEWFTNIYTRQAPSFFHHTTPLLEGSWQVYSGKEKRLNLYFEADYFTVIYLDEEDRSIVFCNQFNYKTSKDVLYFVAFVLEELELQMKAVSLQIGGVLYEDSEIFTQLQRFIPAASLTNEVEWVYFSHHFSEIHHPSFFDVFALTKCVSA